MIQNPNEREQMIRLIQNSLAGIEHKTIIERLGGRIVDGGDLIQIDNECRVEEGGGLREVNVFQIKYYSCGCRADGRSNFGGIDYKGNVACQLHWFRCIRCRRPLSTLTMKAIHGVAYCKRCYRISKFRRFLGLKK